MLPPMTKGYDENKNRVAELASFGKDLARRARSKCELCESAGVALAVHEVVPAEKVPSVERCAFLCAECAKQMSDPRRFENGEHWRCLAKTVWSEIPAVQVLALRGLRRMADSQAWAREAVQEIYVDAEVEVWADASE